MKTILNHNVKELNINEMVDLNGGSIDISGFWFPQTDDDWITRHIKSGGSVYDPTGTILDPLCGLI